MIDSILKHFGATKVRRDDIGRFNLGDICDAFSKNRNLAIEWIVHPASVDYFLVAEHHMQQAGLLWIVSARSVVEIWAHPKLARRFAQDISSEVSHYVDDIGEGQQ